MDRIVGASKWLTEDRFDVIAKAAATVPFEALRGMLKTHSEEQPMPVYVLAPGKKPRLKESDGTARSECNIVNKDRRTFVCQNTTMAQFAERLPNVAVAYIRPTVLDLTGLKGAYDFEVYWTPKGQLNAGGRGADPNQASIPTDDLTVFEAVEVERTPKENRRRPWARATLHNRCPSCLGLAAF